jgi:hypothetical protein
LKLRLDTLALLTLLLAPCACFARNSSLLALGMDHFRDTATVVVDPARGLTTISTERGYVEYSGPLRMVWHDEFLSAVIDDKSGRKSFRIDVAITYGGARRSYPAADLEGMTGPTGVVPTLVSTESANCNVGECIYTDHVEIPVEEALLRRLAAAYVPGQPVALTFRLRARKGADYQGELSNAEIAGLLARLDGYAAAPAAPAEAPLPPRRLEFGISGIAVAPSAEAPNRAGVLVTSVSVGSVAREAGIITGDIIYQLEDRPIHSTADLEAAAAAIPVHSTVTLRIYRGLKETALKARF